MKTPLHSLNILLIEDNLDDAFFVKQLLQKSHRTKMHLHHTVRLSEGVAHLKQQPIDVVLLDVSLPDAKELEGYRLLSNEFPELPIILLTGLDNEDFALETIQQGAQDYILKQHLQYDYVIRVILHALERQKIDNQLKQSNKKLLTALNEKEVLLQELQHRTKNNLQMISSLINLHTAHCKTHSVPVEQVLQDLQQRIRSIAYIHEWLYHSQDLSQLDGSQFLNKLTRNLCHGFSINEVDNLKISTHFPSIMLPIEKAIPCGLIINELVTNAFKHAFAPNQTKELHISFELNNQHEYQILVRDNGKGLPGHVDVMSSNSLGLTLLHTLVSQLGGQMCVERSLGTTFRVSFP